MKKLIRMTVCAAAVVCTTGVYGGFAFFQPTMNVEQVDVEKGSSSSSSQHSNPAPEGEGMSAEDGTYEGAAALVENGTAVSSTTPWKGTWSFVLTSEADEDSGSGYVSGNGANIFSLTVAQKAAVTISGTMANGVKVSIKTKLYKSDEGVTQIPVIVNTKKAGSFSFILFLTSAGEVGVTTDGDWDASSLKKPFVASFTDVSGGNASLSYEDEDGERMFTFDADIDELPGGYEWMSDITPDGVGIMCTSKKWKAEKAGKVKFSKKTGDYEASETNPAGLKISYSKKKGTFSGSFTLYGMLETAKGTYKLKKFKATVKGSAVGGYGYGTATIKNVGSFPVSVE